MRAAATILAVLSLLAGVARAEALGSAHVAPVGGCHRHYCRDHLTVERGKTTRWESAETFGTALGDTSVDVLAYVHGRYLMASWRGCRGYYFGHGVALVAVTCGDPTTIRIRAITFRPHARVLLRYVGGS